MSDESSAPKHQQRGTAKNHSGLTDIPTMWPPRFLRRRMGELGRSDYSRSFRELCDSMASAVLPLLMIALGLLLLLAALFRLGPQESAVTAAAALVVGLTGLVLLLGVVVVKRGGGLVNNPQQVAAGTLIVASLGFAVAMAAAGSLAETIFVVLLLVCAGMALLRAFWFVSTVSAIWLLWLGAAAFLSGSLEVGGYLLAMVGATVLAVAINAIRLSSLMALVAAMDGVQSETVRDAETGLLNRRGLAEVGRELLALGRRFQEPISCTVLEVVSRPHTAASESEETVSEVAVCLVPVFRDSDALARWDDQQFVILALGSGPRVEEIEQRLRSDLDPLLEVELTGGRVVHMPWQEENVEQLVDRGIDEMYRRDMIKQARVGDDRAT